MGTGGVPMARIPRSAWFAKSPALTNLNREPLRRRISLSKDIFTMFTGIIEAVGKIESLERGEDGGRLRVSLAGAREIAREIEARRQHFRQRLLPNRRRIRRATHFSADLSGETLRRTSFGEKKAGDMVNLERPLAAERAAGRTFRSGARGRRRRASTRLVPEGDNWWLSVRVPEDLRRYVAEKGSIAIDGISLTVARWQDGVADFAIIPFTYEHTNIRAMAAGDAVNLECDILAKYVESLLATR